MRSILCRFLLLASLAWCAVSSTAQVINPTYVLQDYGLTPQSAKRITLTPLAAFGDYSGAVLSSTPIVRVTDTNGSYTFTNIVSGHAYRVEWSTPYGVVTRTNGYPTGLSGNVNSTPYLGDLLGQTFYYKYVGTNGPGSPGYVFTTDGTNFYWAASAAGGGAVIPGTANTVITNAGVFQVNVTSNLFDLAGDAQAKAQSATNILGPGLFPNSRSNQFAIDIETIAANGIIAATNILITNASITAKAIGAYDATFLPSMLPGLQLWLKADSLVLSDGASVSSWTDSSGYNRHAVQATGAKQPIFKLNQIGGKPALVFANPNVLTTPSFLDSSFDKSFTFFQVARKNSTAFRVSAVNGGTAFYAGRNNDNYEYDARAGVAIIDARAIDTQAAVVECYRYDGTTRVIRINGVQIASLPDTTINGLSGALNIGDTGGSFTWDGPIAEMPLYNVALSDNDCRLVEDYLARKYSLRRGHIIFDGASNTQGLGAAAFTAYPIQCITNLGGAPLWSGEDMGVGGQKALDLLTNTPTRAFLATWTPNDVYGEWAGDNDLGIGGATPVSVALVYNTIVTNLSNARKSGLHTYVVSLLPGIGASTDVNYEANRQILNTMLRTNWQSFCDAFADVGNDATIGQASSPNNATYFQADKLHLTAAGHTIVANYVANAIRSVFIPGANGYPAGSGVLITNVSEPSFTFSDITTANVSTTKHGLTPKLDNVVTHFLNGQGGFTTPAGSGGSPTFDATQFGGPVSGTNILSGASFTNIQMHGVSYFTNASTGSYISFTQGGFIGSNGVSRSWGIVTNDSLTMSNFLSGKVTSITNGSIALNGTGFAGLGTGLTNALGSVYAPTVGPTFTSGVSLSGGLLADSLQASGNVTTTSGQFAGNAGGVTNIAFPINGAESANNLGTAARYFSPSGTVASTTESNASGPSGAHASYLTNFYIRYSTIGASTNYTALWVTNGVDSNLSISISGAGALATGNNTSIGVPIPAGQTFSLKILGNNATIGTPMCTWSVERVNVN